LVSIAPPFPKKAVADFDEKASILTINLDLLVGAAKADGK